MNSLAQPDEVERLTLIVRANTLAGREVPPRVWHWRDWIPGRTVTLFTSDGGGGKTTLALQLAVATVAQVPWLGVVPKAGPVLYLAAEDDLDELHRRLDEICLALGLNFEDLADLHLWPLADQCAVLATEGHGGTVEYTDLCFDLGLKVMGIEPALVILDSLADVYSANENSRAQVRQFVGRLRKIAIAEDCAVLVLGHPSLAGMSSGSGSSGSTAWNNSVRSRIYMTKPDEEGADPDERILSLRKANYTRAQADMRVRREVGGFMLLGSRPAGGRLDAATERGRVDETFLALLAAYDAQGRHVSHKTGHAYAPALFAKEPLANGASKAGLAAAMNRLFAAGAIRVEGFGPPSRRLQRIVRADTGAEQ